jgi:hypothetical protein
MEQARTWPLEDERAMRAIQKCYALLIELAQKNTAGTGDSAANQPPVPADTTLASSQDEVKK